MNEGQPFPHTYISKAIVISTGFFRRTLSHGHSPRFQSADTSQHHGRVVADICSTVSTQALLTKGLKKTPSVPIALEFTAAHPARRLWHRNPKRPKWIYTRYSWSYVIA